MILNAFALTLLFVDAISLLLIIGAGASALYLYRQAKRSESIDERWRAKDRLHLPFLLLSTAFFIRLAAWPLFYILLHSLIPLVPGAMCIFGVTRVMPKFVAFLQVMKPVTFYLAGGWLILYLLDLSFKTRPLMHKAVRFLTVVSVLAMVDGIAEIFFILTFVPPGVAVSCCTAVADIAMPRSPLRPDVLFGAQYHHVLMAGYHLFNLGLIVFLGLLLRRIFRGPISRSLPALAAAIASVNAAIAYGAFRERIGPRLLDLPDHHCLYCLFQYRPVSIILLGFFLMGSFFAIWPLLLSILGKPGIEEELSSNLVRKLIKYAIACLAASWIATVVMLQQ
jgi:hypothetical protein